MYKRSMAGLMGGGFSDWLVKSGRRGRVIKWGIAVMLLLVSLDRGGVIALMGS